MISPHTTQHTGKHGNSNFTSALLLPGEEDNARVNPQLSRFELMRGDGTHWSRSQIHPQSDTTGMLRPCGAASLPRSLPSLTFLGSFLSDIHLPGSFEIKPSHSTASLTMKKRWVFLFCCRRTHPLGMTLPSLTAERTPFPAQRSRLPPPHRPAGGEERF